MGLHHNHFVRINTDELINEEGADYVLDIHNGKACLYLKEGMACVEYNRDDKKLSEYYLNPDRKDECANWEATWGFFLMLMRKIYITHALLYGRGFVVKNIDFVYMNEEEYVVKLNSDQDKTSGFPYVISTISTSKFVLPTEFKELTDIIVKKKADEELADKAIVALYSYLQSKNRRHEIDRLINLWTAMNAYYSKLVERFNRKARNKYESLINEKLDWCESFEIDGEKINKMDYLLIQEEIDNQGQKLLKQICVEKIGLCNLNSNVRKFQRNQGFKLLIEKKNKDKESELKGVNYNGDLNDVKNILEKAAEYEYDATDDRLTIKYSDLYEKVLEYSKSGDGHVLYEKYPEMYEWSKHFHENLYLLILIDLSYYLRCQFVHGNVTNLTTYEAMGDFNKAVALANFFMDRFLTDNLPDFLMSEEMDDDIFDMCRKWLYKRRKNQSPFNRPEGFLDYIYSITRENGNSTNETVE